MKLSDQKKAELYSAISDPIMEVRVCCLRGSVRPGAELDQALFTLEQTVWLKVQQALNLKGD